MQKIPASEITPEHLFWQRRQFVKQLTLGGAAMMTACAAPDAAVNEPSTDDTETLTGTVTAGVVADATTVVEATSVPDEPRDELGGALTSYEAVTGYNNYYEFTTDKEAVAAAASSFVVQPWSVVVDGMVQKPGQFALEDLLAIESEERIYRLRCVEGWSMVIPWYGFPLHRLLSKVEPTSTAQYVRFETLHDPARMPGQNEPWYQWPYVEGLRLDEAMHDLTLIATGVYGKDLPNQNGAPLRLAVPWKYGFKSAKAIVRIELVERKPQTFWNMAVPNEYGFFANVNPAKPHPRWSQAVEQLIPNMDRVATLPYNGYGKWVEGMYNGTEI